MIKKKFNIPIYDWKVLFVRIEGKDDFSEYEKALKSFGMCDDTLIDSEKKTVEADGIGGGICISNGDLGKAVICIRNQRHKSKEIATMSHESYHLACAICEWAGVEDEEATAYLISHIMEKIL